MLVLKPPNVKLALAACFFVNVLLFGFSANAFAAPNPSSEELKDTTNNMLNMVDKDREGFSPELQKADFSQIKIGSKVLLYTLNNNEYIEAPIALWPLTENGKVVTAIAALGEENSDATLGFQIYSNYTDALNSIENQGEPLAILISNESIYIVSQNHWAEFNSEKNTLLRSDQSDTVTPNVVTNFRNSIPIITSEENIEFSYAKKPNPRKVRSVSTGGTYTKPVAWHYMHLNVPVIHQKSLPVCWAASCLSIGQYLTSTYSDYQLSTPAKQSSLAGQLAISIKGEAIGGSNEDFKKALATFTYDGRTYIQSEYSNTGYLSDSEIANWIGNGIPIYIAMGNSTDTFGHGVVLDGCEFDENGNPMIRIMNPWGNGGKEDNYTILKRSSSSSEFVFSPNVGHVEHPDDWVFHWNSGYVKLTGWQRQFGETRWNYFGSDGLMATSWHQIGGLYYYFDTAGTMQTGWIQDGSNWYFMNDKDEGSLGVMQTGWLSHDGSWYYLNNEGKMQTGWQKIDGVWYYFNGSGAMQSGWQAINAEWFYLNPNHDGTFGAMQTGWLSESGSWYYLRPAANVPVRGSMGAAIQSISARIDGKTYNFNYSGVCTNP